MRKKGPSLLTLRFISKVTLDFSDSNGRKEEGNRKKYQIIVGYARKFVVKCALF